MKLSELESRVTEKHPELRAARERLAQLEAVYQKELTEAREAYTVPNPFHTELSQRLLLLKLQEPRAIEMVAWKQKLADKRARDDLPNISIKFIELERSRDKQGVSRRLIARVDEIEVARNLSINNLQILEPADRKYAQEQDKLAKVGLSTGGALGLGLGIAAVIGLMGAVCDRLRTMEDCAEIWVHAG